MDGHDALPLVRFINRYDDRYRAESLFLTDGEAIVLLSEKSTCRTLPPLLRWEEYVSDACKRGEQTPTFAANLREWLIAQGRANFS